MNPSPTPDLPSWDELDLPVLDEVVDDSAVPVLEEEVLDVPDFDFSSELDSMQHTLDDPQQGMAELEIPELTLEYLEVTAPPPASATAPAALDPLPFDLAGLPSLDLDEAVAGELTLAQVLPGDQQPAATSPDAGLPATPPAVPEPPMLAVDGFEFMLDTPAAPLPPDAEAMAPPTPAEHAGPLLDSVPPAVELAADVLPSPAAPLTEVGSAGPSIAPQEVAPAQPAPLPGGLSIALDSLPAGVLGGGIGRLEAETPSAAELLARAQALVANAPTSLDDVLRAAEQTLSAQEGQLPPSDSEYGQKSFTSLSEAELLAAMSELPSMPPVQVLEEDWPGLDEVGQQPPAAGLGAAEENDGVAAEPPQPAPLPDAEPPLLGLEQEEGWPGIGEVDRENETELNTAEETPDVAVQDRLPVHTEPPLLEPEEEWPHAGDIDRQSDTEHDGEAVAPAATAMPGLFAESPFACERQPPATPAQQVEDAVPAPASVAAETAPELAALTGESFAAAMPHSQSQPVAAESGKAVEVLSVAAVTTASAAAAMMHPAQRKEETVAVVDERALVDAMYDKLLPRMKVELSLWLQDALELQAKNMLSGVMQQLKEDYDMLFGDTLKESLRQAIIALGREQQELAQRPDEERD